MVPRLSTCCGGSATKLPAATRRCFRERTGRRPPPRKIVTLTISPTPSRRVEAPPCSSDRTPSARGPRRSWTPMFDGEMSTTRYRACSRPQIPPALQWQAGASSALATEKPHSSQRYRQQASQNQTGNAKLKHATPHNAAMKALLKEIFDPLPPPVRTHFQPQHSTLIRSDDYALFATRTTRLPLY